MNQCIVYINGEKCAEHKGGYLPFIVEISEYLNWEKNNIIAVKTDNRDDFSFPPGRPERMMDYSYYGGIYRDVWCFSTDKLHISDPLRMNKPADGGIFIHSKNVSAGNAQLHVSSNIINECPADRSFTLETILKDPNGKVLKSLSTSTKLPKNEDKTLFQTFNVENPALWEPETPELYSIDTFVEDEQGNIIDALTTKTGIRKIEIRNGNLFLNGDKRFLFGTNRHQELAYIGNALPNSAHYRDACRMREASFDCYRSHYPQDPAFMDACDFFGILAINSVPSWWFYSPDNGFPESCIQAIRQMIKINRNRPSCFIWEIGLNESFYPSDYIAKAHKAAREEYPYDSTFTAEEPPVSYHGGYYKDGRFLNKEDYPRDQVNEFPCDITYHHHDAADSENTKPYFCRESSGFYDNFVGENAVHAVCRDWGETPMFIQVKWYIQWLNELYKQKAGLGACIWLAFDHNRGCSAETAYKGQMDCYRLPKTSFYFFKSQSAPDLKLKGVSTGPMVHIANHLTPFSPEDIIVFTNCEKIRLTLPNGEVLEKVIEKDAMKHPPVVFKGLFNWQKETPKWASPTAKSPDSGKVIVEGIINGKVVATDKRQAASRVSGLKLELDDRSHPLFADGCDLIAVRAYFVDKYSNPRVLARQQVYFKIEGEGEIVGDSQIFANPFNSQFGTAVVFVKSSTNPGIIRVTASTTNMGKGEISIETVNPEIDMIKGLSENTKKLCSNKMQFNEVSGSDRSEDDFEIQGIVTPVLNPNHE